MYKIILTAIAFFSFVGLNSCAQQKNLVQKPSFTIENSAFSSWVSGDAKKNSGMDVSFTINTLPDNVSLDSIFFKGQVAPIVQGNQKNRYVAHFVSEEKGDLIISSDMSKESNNPKPHIPQKSPIPIKPDQALLIYSKNGKKQYHKITTLKDRGTKYPGEAPMQAPQPPEGE